MIDNESYIESLKARLADVKKQLEPLEAGTLLIGTKLAGGEWIDVTPEWIKRHRETIATYERLLAVVQARELARSAMPRSDPD